ncbi:sensor histidine kinase, partial [Streptomyces sp. S6]
DWEGDEPQWWFTRYDDTGPHLRLRLHLPHDFGSVARRAVSGLEGVSVEVVADAVVATDPRRVERVLTNLAANALRHGSAPVVVTVDGPAVRVRDHGPGFPDDLLAVLHASGPQRFRTGERTGGTGLGLTIATGQARLLEAQLTFRNHPEGGAETELRLPERSV